MEMLPCKTCGRNRAGEKVTIKDRTWGAAEVVGDAGYIGIDGKHWLEVKIGSWKFSAPCHETEHFEEK